MKKIICLSLLIGIHTAQSQQKHSLLLTRDTSMLRPGVTINAALQKIRARSEKIRSLKMSGLLITYGFVALDNNNLVALDKSIKNEIRENHPFFHTSVDDFLQYAPGLAVYGLNAMGIGGKNDFRDRTMIYLLSNCMMGITVHSLKKIISIQRPDGIGTNAFPSGHTATAFAAAEFLRQEYNHVSPWYGVAGYLTATATGALRIYNNKHWARDIVSGAGFGILSTKIAYWIYPAIKRKFSKSNSLIMPYYHNGVAGILILHTFN